MKQKILAEIERLNNNLWLDDRHDQGVSDGLHAISKFINSLPEEPVSEDLDEASENYSISDTNGYDKEALYTGFKNGAKWDRKRVSSRVIEWLESNLLVSDLSKPLYMTEDNKAAFIAEFRKMLEDG